MLHQPKVELQEIIKNRERERELEIGGWYGCMMRRNKNVLIINVTASTFIYIYICLTEVSKEDIKYAIQKDEEGNPIINEIEQGIPDGVNTLIYTIMKHFIGKPSNITARIYEQLRQP